MSKCQPELAMRRIDVATPSSPIAVFAHAELGYVDCVFGATSEALRRMSSADSGFIGLFHTASPRQATLDALRAAARQSAPRERRSA